ncbi:VWA domain-containing protein [Kitasatospora sp. MMS16-BH015]|uniref:vWA domain-containing protein n=1 Tax=Kitasatospora sp. MMS16-BH015 TaxID=2018025 RepID=UPI000CA20AE0|nr:VWA domain-containing protein [Kitasatospora sp. MMS16-BH015]AUG76299.1 VWA domain-containing protein [Kitasatospora sp. MMS16-BH015]
MTASLSLGFGQGYDERQPVIVLLDTSASMGRPADRPRIAELNRALADWFDSVRAQPRLRARVEVCLVTFDSEVRVFDPATRALVPRDRAAAATATSTGTGTGTGTAGELFAPIDGLQPPELAAGGCTNLLPAIRLALDLAADRHRALTAQGVPVQRPVIWLLTDGAPTDGAGTALSPADLAADAALLRRAEEERGCVFFVVGVQGADQALLEVLAPEATYLLDTLDFTRILDFLFQSVDRIDPRDSAGQTHRRVAAFARVQATLASLVEEEL